MRLEDIKNAIIIWGPISQEGLSKIKKEESLVVVSENRPYLLGLKHNIPLLEKENIKYIYCTDNVLGFLFYKERIKKVYIFYKRETSAGFLSFCGSLYVLSLSKLHEVPVENIAGAELALEDLDKDASSLAGRDFVLGNKEKKYIIEAEDEIIPKEVLV